MVEYRTRPLDRNLLLGEARFVFQRLRNLGIESIGISFGWDSDLPIDEMWKEVPVPTDSAFQFLTDAELAGTVVIGGADIFFETEVFCFILCHEGDIHVSGASPLLSEVIERWRDMGYEPYAIKQTA